MYPFILDFCIFILAVLKITLVFLLQLQNVIIQDKQKDKVALATMK